MATTPRQIIVAAYYKSTKNNPSRIDTESAALVQALDRALRRMFTYGTRINPYFYAVRLAQNAGGIGDTWARPADAEMVIAAETAAGAPVTVLLYEDRDGEPAKPAVYELGQVFHRANTLLGLGGPLTLVYARRPAAIVNLDSPIDPLWPEHFNALLILEIAALLAFRDGRMDEVQGYAMEFTSTMQLYGMFLEHATIATVGDLPTTKFAAPTIIPTLSVLTGEGHDG